MPEYGSKSSGGVLGKRRQVVVDSCWSVPIASACTAFLACLATSSYGYLYVLFIEEYGIKREQAAWPQSSLVIAAGCAGLLVSLVEQKLRLHQIALMGAVITSTGLMASAFAPNIAWLTVTFGVVQGAGMGVALLGVAMYLLLYFDKYKATATAIKEIGTVAAGVTGVPMTSYFTAKYGLQGCLLLTGGVMLHILPVIMLIRNPHPYKTGAVKEENDKSDHRNDATEVCIGNGNKAPCAESPGGSRQTISSPGTSADSSLNILSTFAMPAFYVVVLLQVISDYTFSTYTTTIVDYAVDKGTGLASAKKILVYNALGQAVGRVLLPFISDKIPFSRSPIAVTCFLAAAACLFAVPLVSAFEQIVALASLTGVAQGYILCIRPLITADHVGLARFSFCCGLGGLASIPVWLSGPIILGSFRDSMGSYKNLYFLIAGLNLLVATLLAMLVCSSLIQRRRRQATKAFTDKAPKLRAMKKIPLS
ncbi:monocarboxylate transporter 12-like isoform X2 [Amblyomma americanum]